MVDLTGKIKQSNGRLKAGKVGFKIEQRGEKLIIRGILPPKPGSKKEAPYQQRLTLGIPANANGLQQAEAEAKMIGGLVACRQFVWESYLKQKGKPKVSIGEWVERFHCDYLKSGGSEENWKGEYRKAFKKLPLESEPTPEIFESAIDNTPENSRTRVRLCTAIKKLCEIAELDYDPMVLKGNYSPSKVSPRDIPEDQLIAEKFYQLRNPGWRWVYGMMATYGIRNHEAFRLNLEGMPIIEVLENTKTGSRQVWPCFPEWVEDFDLEDCKLPNVDVERSNQSLGAAVTYHLSEKLPFTPYDLRHAWAIRTLEFNWPVELAARQMGHSVDIHTRTYHRWISRKRQQRMFELLVMREDRPKPPKVNQT